MDIYEQILQWQSEGKSPEEIQGLIDSLAAQASESTVSGTQVPIPPAFRAWGERMVSPPSQQAIMHPQETWEAVRPSIVGVGDPQVRGALETAARQAFPGASSYSPENVTGGGDRFMAGLASDIPTEELKYHQQTLPPGTIGPRLLQTPQGEIPAWQTGPGAPVTYGNLPGFDLGDIAQAGGMAIAPVTTALSFGGGPVGLAGKVLATEAAREMGQAFFGTQAETPEQLAQRGGTGLALDIATGYMSKPTAVAYDLFRGAGKAPASGPLREEMTKILAARAAGGEKLALHSYQISDNPIVKRFARQAMMMSPKQADDLLKQIRSAEKEISSLRTPLREAAAERLQRKAEAVYEVERAKISPAPDPTAGGEAGIAAVRKWFDDTKVEQNRLYEDVRTAGELEKPRFDLRDAKARIAELDTVAAESAGEASVLTGAVRTAQQQLEKMENLTGNYDALMNIRTLVGKAIEQDPGLESGIASQAYKALTETLKKPVREAPLFRERFDAASAYTKAFHDDLRHEPIRRVRSAEYRRTPTMMFDEMADHPARFEEVFRNRIGLAAPEESAAMAHEIRNRILSQPNALDTIRRWKNDAPRAYSWAVPPKSQAAFRRQARQMDRLNARGLAKVAQGVGNSLDFGKQLLGDIKSPEQAQQFLKTFRATKEGLPSRRALRTSVVEEVFDGITRPMEHGITGFDAPRLSRNILAAKERGWWDLLSKNEQIRIEGLNAYLTRAMDRADSGTSLEVASMVSRFKDPRTAPSALLEWRINRILASMFTNPKISDAVFRAAIGSGKAGTDPNTFRAGAVAIENFVADLWRQARENPSEEPQGI